MRVLVIILAVIGGLLVTSVAGCVGCVGCALLLSQGSSPDHFRAEQIRAQHGSVIEAVRAAAADHRPLNHQELRTTLGEDAEDLVAIFAESTDQGAGSFSQRQDLYGRHTIAHNGHSLWNGAGTVWLTVNGERGTFAAYTIHHQQQEWLLVLRDWLPEQAEE